VAGDLKPNTRRKFALAYLSLAALVGGAIGLFVLFVERPAPPPAPPWSLWQPTASAPLDRATEIAGHVAVQYHLPSGHRLVRVLVGGPGTASDPIRALAVAKTANAKSQSDFQFVNAAQTMMFELCGAGPQCAIREGKATLARGAVLRREALELALYTFKYVPQADSVVTFFPPKLGAQPSFALFFKKSDLSSQLHHPLVRTLPRARAPLLQGKLPGGERKTIDELTTPRFFQFAVQRVSTGERVLVLEPVVS
jgi:hypothetical protein